jgi:hypothetical protein
VDPDNDETESDFDSRNTVEIVSYDDFQKWVHAKKQFRKDYDIIIASLLKNSFDN